MQREDREKYQAYGVSALLHIVLFLVLAVTGFFVQLEAKKPPVDVTVYDLTELGGGGYAGGAAPVAASAGETASADAVVVEETRENLPEIAEEYTKEPEKQKQYVETHKTAATPPTAFGGAHSTGASTGTGGSGSGTGQGSGSGHGTGVGSGTGTGSGHGTGSGSGDGAADRHVPKTPPQFLGGAEPKYPADLWEADIGGTVVLSLTVGADGSVSNISVASSSGYAAFDKAARKAAGTYRFSPAKNAYGEPVVCIITKRVIFEP